MEFLRDVIYRQLTADIACPCGYPVTHLSDDLVRLAGAEGSTRHADAFEGHVFEGEVLCEPALPLVEICLAALTQELSAASREAFTRILLRIVSASGQGVGAVGGERNIVQECLEAVRRGTWLFYAEVFNCRAPGASALSFMILEKLGEDPALLGAAYRVAQPALRSTPPDHAGGSLDAVGEQWGAKDFLRDEIARQLPEGVACPCGESVSHLGDDLLYLAEAGNGSPRVNGFEGHVFNGEFLYKIALPVAKICMAALTQRLAAESRMTFIKLLDWIVSGDPGLDVPAGRDFIQEIKEVVEQARWMLYAEVFNGATSGASGYAFMILQELGDDPDRLRSAYQAAYSTVEWVRLDSSDEMGDDA
ncbi:hypothetical protein [Actinomadura oligospora]|uniref:hypothetical protein n=1 Tax=Actinomadura oligospora TaxID=111804 RepID=UPI00047AEAE4|nr:hypothetical protein [Actinomadura oligospora]